MGDCRVCGAPVHGSGRKYCEGCKPKLKAHGYVYVYVPGHPRANRSGYVAEHIVVMEREIGRSISESEQIHHVDRDRSNNDPRNLVLCAGAAEHGAAAEIDRRAAIMANLRAISEDQWHEAWQRLCSPGRQRHGLPTYAGYLLLRTFSAVGWIHKQLSNYRFETYSRVSPSIVEDSWPDALRFIKWKLERGYVKLSWDMWHEPLPDREFMNVSTKCIGSRSKNRK